MIIFLCEKRPPPPHKYQNNFKLKKNTLHSISGGVPKVGQLQNAAWNLSDTCRFKVLSQPAPITTSANVEQHRRCPSPASNSNSTGTGLTASSLSASIIR